MSVTRQHLGGTFPGVKETPLYGGKGQAPSLLAPVMLFVAMFVGILLAFQSNNVIDRWQIAGLGVALGALGVTLLVWERSVTVGVVRFERHATSLRFSYPAGLDLLYPLTALLVILPATVALVPLLQGASAAGIGSGRRSVAVIGLLGLVLMAQQLWALRVPRGLELTPEGLRGVRGMGRLVVDWEDLGAASALSTRSGAKLSLRLKTGEVSVLQRRLIGSDPDAVAAIITYYLRHPADRGLLADPEAAIRRVAQGS